MFTFMIIKMKAVLAVLTQAQINRLDTKYSKITDSMADAVGRKEDKLQAISLSTQAVIDKAESKARERSTQASVDCVNTINRLSDNMVDVFHQIEELGK